MPIKLEELAQRIKPENTILLFGAGSSIPSGAPTVEKIIEKFSLDLDVDKTLYSLSEISSLYELKRSRKEMVNSLRALFRHKRPTGSILNLPLYDWKCIYSTNYDDFVEQSYTRHNRDLTVISSNFDFGIHDIPEATKLMKLHGTLGKDVIDGVHSRIIISEGDYDLTEDYREALYKTLELDLMSSNLVVIGYSLSDPHIKALIDKAIKINHRSQLPGQIFLVMFEVDELRAALFENRGITVSFGGIDDFLIAVESKSSNSSHVYSATGDPLDVAVSLRPITLCLRDEVDKGETDPSAMFNGWPASYRDITSNLTFRRSLALSICDDLDGENFIASIILGVSGSGKTTLAKQVLCQKEKENWHCWEHKTEHKFLPKKWRDVAKKLKENNHLGIVFVDEAHNHLYEISELVNTLAADKNFSLKLVVTSARHQWSPRIKSPNLTQYGKTDILGKLDSIEIDGLLTLVDTNSDLKPLIENSFSGFSRSERRRRLTARCNSDTFVCLKNIFASEKFDDIILREYAELEENEREIYKLVSALESSGINVHRQLIIRLLSIDAQQLNAALAKLTDIIHETTISEKSGIYGWKGRHNVITNIVATYKFPDIKEYYKLFDMVIENVVPTYEYEVRSLIQLCNFESGLGRFNDKQMRNTLLRKMISRIPGARVPRHRLIDNLIKLNELEKAETEIRLFENDFGADGPVNRYKILLLLARAEHTPGILEEDRVAILEQARSKAMNAAERYSDNKHVLNTYCEVGFQYFRRVNDLTVFDDAMKKLRTAEDRLDDSDITNILIKYQNMMNGVRV
jgi:hypothetical protein